MDDVENLRIGTRRFSTWQVIAGFILFQCVTATVLYVVFRLPVLSVAGAFAVTLPGHIRSFRTVTQAAREDAKLGAGATLLALIGSFFLAFILTSFLERPSVSKTDLSTFCSMAMGSIYFLLRILLDGFIHWLKEENRHPQHALPVS